LVHQEGMAHVFITGRRKAQLDSAVVENEASYVSGVELFVDGGVAQI
jgi:hypothetical protein